MSRILAILNQKGGVGKTTTAVNLAAGLAQAGQRTLLVDLDPQGNATTGLGIRKSTLSATVYDVLRGDCDWTAATVSTSLPNLDLLPATLDLAGAVVELTAMREREYRLRAGLAGAPGQYAFVVIDTPPSLGLLPINSMTAASEALIPLQCEFYALEALAQLEHAMRMVKRRLNPALEVFGILLTMVDTRTRLCREVMRAVRWQYGPRVFSTVIPRTVRLAEAPSFGEPVLTFDPRSKGARAYRNLTREVLDR